MDYKSEEYCEECYSMVSSDEFDYGTCQCRDCANLENIENITDLFRPNSVESGLYSLLYSQGVTREDAAIYVIGATLGYEKTCRATLSKYGLSIEPTNTPPTG